MPGLIRARRTARPHRPTSSSRRVRLTIELLESRALLSANKLIHTLAFPNDPGSTQGLQWDVGAGFGSNATAAWKAGFTGQNAKAVYVGVVDEGIQYTHTDLTGRVRNPGEIANNLKDDDGNGLVDDAYGW